MSTPASVDVILKAISDPTRRAVYERLSRAEEITVVDLTRASGVTQGAISQHLKTLKNAGLVAERPEGRKVFYRAKPEGFDPLFDWMRHYGLFWRERLGDLHALLEEIDPQETAK